MSDVQSGENDNIFSSSPHIPVYVMLPVSCFHFGMSFYFYLIFHKIATFLLPWVNSVS